MSKDKKESAFEVKSEPVSTVAKLSDLSRYDKLDKHASYDKEKAEQYAAAHEEMAKLQERVARLKSLIEDNDDMAPFVWRTSNNDFIALHKIADDHMENIVKHIVGRGDEISEPIRREAERRGIAIPVVNVEALTPRVFRHKEYSRALDILEGVAREEGMSW